MVVKKTEMRSNGPELPLTAKMPNMDYRALHKICRLGMTAIAKIYGLKYTHTTDGGFWFKDNGADILAVGHEDSQLPFTHFTVNKMRHDTVIFCPTLDDRLGLYLILEYFPKIQGINYDILITTNEEKGSSTARSFRTNKDYNWMFMFDRHGTDSAVYNYGDKWKRDGSEVGWSLALEDAGLEPTHGMYSCIKDLEFLGCKGVNIGVGYHNNHHVEAFARKNELLQQIRHFLTFYEENANIHYPHVYIPPRVARLLSHTTNKDEAKVSKVRNIANQKKQEKESEYETIDRVVKAIRDEEAGSGKWKAKRRLLQFDIDVLSIESRLIRKLKKLGINQVGELARRSSVEVLRLDDLTKLEVDELGRVLGKLDLSFATNLSNYGLIPHQGWIGEIVRTYEEDNQKEEPRPIIKMPVTLTKETTDYLKSDQIVQIEKKEIGYKAPPAGIGEIRFTLPLIKGDNAELFTNADGEVKWTYPIPKQFGKKIGFDASRVKQV